MKQQKVASLPTKGLLYQQNLAIVDLRTYTSGFLRCRITMMRIQSLQDKRARKCYIKLRSIKG